MVRKWIPVQQKASIILCWSTLFVEPTSHLAKGQDSNYLLAMMPSL
ncbi:MAG: hypothetical protein OEZ30_05730 [Candidatus Aminicenantes bacterium]|nr:hypothetical protein [Candidatus Aminicenantes bacterium]MDH5715044.1 hypothetical protein [Candidatus Aminicenantes bacterium]